MGETKTNETISHDHANWQGIWHKNCVNSNGLQYNRFESICELSIFVQTDWTFVDFDWYAIGKRAIRNAIETDNFTS